MGWWVGRGGRGGLNEVLDSMGGWVGGLVLFSSSYLASSSINHHLCLHRPSERLIILLREIEVLKATVRVVFLVPVHLENRDMWLCECA